MSGESLSARVVWGSAGRAGGSGSSCGAEGSGSSLGPRGLPWGAGWDGAVLWSKADWLGWPRERQRDAGGRTGRAVTAAVRAGCTEWKTLE